MQPLSEKQNVVIRYYMQGAMNFLISSGIEKDIAEYGDDTKVRNKIAARH